MNAIILAAGLGSRFHEMTTAESKTLLPVNGVPGLERTIRFLHKIGVREIHIVIGHMAERFYYLKEKYDVDLIDNPDYKKYNNVHSMSLAVEHLGDTLVIDGDVVILGGLPLPGNESCYYLVRREEEGAEWVPVVDDEGRVTEMTVTDARLPSLLGISYWTASAGRRIRQEFSKLTERDYLDPKGYWDTIPTELYEELPVYTIEIERHLAAEMDNQEQYEKICRLAAEQ